MEETAKEHDQTGALLLVLRCIEAHPIIFSWLVGSFFILQASPSSTQDTKTLISTWSS